MRLYVKNERCRSCGQPLGSTSRNRQLYLTQIVGTCPECKQPIPLSQPRQGKMRLKHSPPPPPKAKRATKKSPRKVRPKSEPVGETSASAGSFGLEVKLMHVKVDLNQLRMRLRMPRLRTGVLAGFALCCVLVISNPYELMVKGFGVEMKAKYQLPATKPSP